METIFALATVPGRSALAIVRVSGPDSQDSLQKLTSEYDFPLTRQTSLRRLKTDNNVVIDEALVTFFAAPKSYTGENIVEYQLHGGWSVIQSMLHFLSAQKNHRLAEPGEFTRRAFENNKLDLTEAEAVADLIDAETESQRRQALDQLSGTLESIYNGWRHRLASIMALMEADLDFSDQDLPDNILLKSRPDLTGLIDEIKNHLNDGRRGERLRNGFQVVILGAPNAGKSSLLNCLAQREAAIVSPNAGTTRDVIEVHLDIDGLPVVLTDTAGLRPLQELAGFQGDIEAQGIERAMNKAQMADLKILLVDSVTNDTSAITDFSDEKSIIVYTKADLGIARTELTVSSVTGFGIEALLKTIAARLSPEQYRNKPTLTRIRHREALLATLESLERSITAPLPELAAEDLRMSIRHIGSITGRVDVEELLDMIFRDFCIGK